MKRNYKPILSFMLILMSIFVLQPRNSSADTGSVNPNYEGATSLSQTVHVTITKYEPYGAMHLHYDDTSQLDYAGGVIWRPDVPDTFEPSRFSSLVFEKVGSGSCSWNSSLNQMECTGDIDQIHTSYDYWYTPRIQDAVLTFKYGTGIQDRNVNLSLDLWYPDNLHFITATITIGLSLNEPNHLRWLQNYNSVFDLGIKFYECAKIVDGICVNSNPGKSCIAKIDMSNPGIKVELVYDLANASTGEFRQKIVEKLVGENSGAGQNGNKNHYYVAINGTAKGIPGPKEIQHLADTPPWQLVYSKASILGINGTAYDLTCVDGSACIGQPQASFFQFIYRSALRIHRAGADFPDDGSASAIQYIWNEIPRSDFVVGYRSSILDTINANSARIPGFPAYVASDDDHILNDPKTAVAVSSDGGTLFLAGVDNSVSTEQLARDLMALGAARAILLDSAWSTQFYSFAQDEIPRNYVTKKFGLFTRKNINGIVVYNANVFPGREIGVPIAGGSFPLSPNVGVSFSSDTFGDSVTVTYTPQFPTNADEFRHVDRFYEIQAHYSNGSPAQPQKPYQMVVSYDPASVPFDAREAELRFYFWNGTAWEVEPTSSINLTNHTVMANPSYFGRWAILTAPIQISWIYLPIIMK